MYTQSSPFQKKSKVKGGGTKKVCLPASKVRSMSAAEKKKKKKTSQRDLKERTLKER